MKLKLKIGLLNNKPVDISEVPSGLECNCYCECGDKLVAKKGNKLAHHFAHYSNSNCNGETMLHKLAQLIIQESGAVYLPIVVDQSTMNAECVTLANTLKSNNIELEKRVSGFIPDVLVDNKVWVEVAVTHFCEQPKIDHAIRNNIDLIEIDLSKVKRDISKNELTELLTDELKASEITKWIHSADLTNHIKARDISRLKERDRVVRDMKKEVIKRKNKLLTPKEKTIKPINIDIDDYYAPYYQIEYRFYAGKFGEYSYYDAVNEYRNDLNNKESKWKTIQNTGTQHD